MYALSDFLITVLSWLVKQSLKAFSFQKVRLFRKEKITSLDERYYSFFTEASLSRCKIKSLKHSRWTSVSRQPVSARGIATKPSISLTVTMGTKK